MPSARPDLTRRNPVVRHCLKGDCSRWIGSVVAVDTVAPEVVLTYDDGPCPDGTPAVLDALAEHGATATFFVLLTRTRSHPGLLREVIAAGHEIGLHGPDHRRLSGVEPREVGRRLRQARAELEAATGTAVRWFRPPYGKQTVRQWCRVRSCGLTSVSWGGDVADWRDVPQVERVTSALRAARPGGILLCHDGFAGRSDGVDDGPAPDLGRGDLARRVLAALGERGLTARSLGDTLDRGVEVRRPWFSR